MNYYGRCLCGNQGTHLLEFRLGPPPINAWADRVTTETLPLCPQCWRLEQLQAAGVVHERFMEAIA